MNREIKFRAWDKKCLSMHRVKQIIDEHTVICYGLKIFDSDIALYFNEFNLMQFTGLKDRNGKEIYEGDIVNEDLAQDGKWQSVGVVEFFEGSFGSRNQKNRFRIPALFSGEATKGMNLNYYEVIGNIYETPNLIK